MSSKRLAVGATLMLVVAFAAGTFLAPGIVEGKGASVSDATAERGDVVSITVSANQKSTVNIGGPDEGFWVQVEGFKGKTTIELNTYESDNKSAVVVSGPKNIEVRQPTMAGPIDAAKYRMNVTADGTPLAVGQLTIEKRQTNGAETFVMPSSVEMKDIDSVEKLQKNVVQPKDHKIAGGDRFVLALNASGVTGFIDSFGSTQGVSLTFRETNHDPNTTPNEFSADDISSKRTFTDPESDVTYFVLDTTRSSIELGDRYNVTFTIDESNPLIENGEESATTSFTVVKRQASIDHYGATVVVDKGKTTISGDTTLAPGSTMKLSAYKYGSNNFVLGPKEVTVTANHTFSETFDFGDVRRGTGFTFKLIGPENDVDVSVPGVVAPQRQTTTTTTTTTTTNTTTTTTTNTTTTNTTTTTTNTTTNTTTTPTTPTTRISTPNPITPQTVSNGGLPGFEAGTAVVALLAAALLAVRRSE